uniref:Uncharacterized protein n=1 Tax=uncultured marine virus TaxID=186617 RepID=A0A0F7L965_9VIRU|nr:hypothetical protein [uncultured marine virus]
MPSRIRKSTPISDRACRYGLTTCIGSTGRPPGSRRTLIGFASPPRRPSTPTRPSSSPLSTTRPASISTNTKHRPSPRRGAGGSGLLRSIRVAANTPTQRATREQKHWRQSRPMSTRQTSTCNQIGNGSPCRQPGAR